MKKLLILFICINISLMPLISISNNSYADSNDSQWIYVNSTENMKPVTSAIIKGYLGSRGFYTVFTYPVEKAIVQWGYNSWDKFAKMAGYNGLSDLNEHIAYRYNSSGVLQFFLDDSAIELLNDTYEAVLSYYNITENSNKQIYDGEWFEDDDGNGCYVFVVNQKTGSALSLSTFNERVSVVGTPYRFSGLEYYNSHNQGYEDYTINYNNKSLTYRIWNEKNNTSWKWTDLIKNNATTSSGPYTTSLYITRTSDLVKFVDGYLSVFKHPNVGYFLGSYNHTLYDNSSDQYSFGYISDYQLIDLDAVNAAISIGQAGMNAGIVAAGKSAAITTGKEGLNAIKDYLEDNDSTEDDVVTPVDDPTPPDDVPTTPDDDPTGGNPPGYNDTGGVLTPDGNGGYNFNFKMPQLNIDWNLGLNVNNLPFPFSIPFDFNNALKMLDVEPETPRFQGTIHVPYINYDWEIDLDFGKYDEYETLINMFQKVLLFGYVISLILATRAVMHIY